MKKKLVMLMAIRVLVTDTKRRKVLTRFGKTQVGRAQLPSRRNRTDFKRVLLFNYFFFFFPVAFGVSIGSSIPL